MPYCCVLLQPDGTAVADFSDALSAEIPSGIQNEQLVVDSIAQTLGANVNLIRQLKVSFTGKKRKLSPGISIYPVYSLFHRRPRCCACLSDS